jgi:predicted amidohydrolase
MSVQDLNVALIQGTLTWEDVPANLTYFEKKLACIKVRPDLIVLPETFTTGFTMEPERVAVSMVDEPVQWMSRMAEKYGAALAGSMIIKEKGSCFNRLIFAEPGGALHHYDKKHLFRMAGEDRNFTPGDRRVVVHYKGWRMALFVCYDLRFPGWMRVSGDYDIALVVANWPERRAAHWKALAVARAVENQSYVLACNIVGTDGNCIRYGGDSAAIDPLGRDLARAGGRERTITAKLSYSAISEYREKFPVWMDAD